MASIRTPWGRPDAVSRIREGIVWADTPSHGGAGVLPSVAAIMPQCLTDLGEWCGDYLWFEEDCKWPAVALAFPVEYRRWAIEQGIAADPIERARQTLAHWYPQSWAAFQALNQPAAVPQAMRNRAPADLFEVSCAPDLFDKM